MAVENSSFRTPDRIVATPNPKLYNGCQELATGSLSLGGRVPSD